MKYLFLFFLCIPFIAVSQHFEIKTPESYDLKGNVKYYKKEYLVNKKKKRGSIEIDSLDHSIYILTPKVTELRFNDKGYLISSIGTRFIGPGWQQSYEYKSFGDVLNFTKQGSYYGQDITYDYEFVYDKNGNMIQESANKFCNFQTPIKSENKTIEYTYDKNDKLTNSIELNIKKRSDGTIDSTKTIRENFYIKNKLWKTKGYFNDRLGYKYYLPFKGSGMYINEVDTLFSSDKTIDKITKTLIADNTEVVYEHNFERDYVERSLTKFDSLGRILSQTKYHDYGNSEFTSNSDFYNVNRYLINTYHNNDSKKLKSQTRYNISENDTIGEKTLSRKYNIDGRMTHYDTRKENRKYEYLKNLKGLLIKIIKKEIENEKVEILETTTYKYDKKDNLIYEKTIDSKGETILEIIYTIEYYH